MRSSNISAKEKQHVPTQTRQRIGRSGLYSDLSAAGTFPALNRLCLGKNDHVTDSPPGLTTRLRFSLLRVGRGLRSDLHGPAAPQYQYAPESHLRNSTLVGAWSV